MIKAVHKELAFEKRAQTAFNKLMAGNLFKTLKDSLVVPTFCPIGQGAQLTWPHFFECFGLDKVAIKEWEDPEVLAELARCIATFPFLTLARIQGEDH